MSNKVEVIDSLSKVSVLMSVYSLEKPANLDLALRSIEHQTFKNFELVLVEDGPLSSELSAVIASYRDRLEIVSVKIPTQGGLNRALNLGLKNCSFKIVIRCDSDDINLPQRFQEQVSFLASNPNTVLISSDVIEFFHGDDGIQLTGMRSVPKAYDEIRRMAKFRSPFNHPSAAFIKSVVLKVGGYPESYPTKMEDYALWLRIIGAGYHVQNLSEPLVLFRADDKFFDRRRGIRYALDEFWFVSEKRRNGICGVVDGYPVAALRAVQRLLPKTALKSIYGLFFRVPSPSIKSVSSGLEGLMK